MLARAAYHYKTTARQYSCGCIIANRFVRGMQRDGWGWIVNSVKRDRVRALQLQLRAIELVEAGPEAAGAWLTLAGYLVRGSNSGEAWRLQYLTGLDTLPDYEERYDSYGESRRAPVNPDGTPVFYYKPNSWEDAQSDGERWRWALAEAMRLYPGATGTVQLNYADFLRSQFAVQTMQYGGFWPRFEAEGDEGRKDETGPYPLHTLGEDETIARLASGIRRFKLPDEFNYIAIYKALAEERGHVSEAATIRVEEYKKPEFEVKVEAPAVLVMLGETIAAKVTATYYFGAPVTEAKVNYKVLRSSHDARWYPWGRWDWLYGRGYWWYPGWAKWGCLRPIPWWWDFPSAQPELVAEAEVPIGADGTAAIEIDTALIKAIQGDTDHRYEITAEVTDQSRRTIVGTGTVLVAREPFKVYA